MPVLKRDLPYSVLKYTCIIFNCVYIYSTQLIKTPFLGNSLLIKHCYGNNNSYNGISTLDQKLWTPLNLGTFACCWVFSEKLGLIHAGFLFFFQTF